MKWYVAGGVERDKVGALHAGVLIRAATRQARWTEAGRRLAKLGGTAPNLEYIPRRRSEPSPEYAEVLAKLES